MSISRPTRICFVTIGATAAFTDLLLAALDCDFLALLADSGYTKLRVQCGPDLQLFRKKLDELDYADEIPVGLTISGFDYLANGLIDEMAACKGDLSDNRREGVVIAHAGAGTILDAMRISTPLIVIPNSTLLDNHQAELAHELEKQGYVTAGTVTDLSTALRKADKLSSARQVWPPAPVCNFGKLLSDSYMTKEQQKEVKEKHEKAMMESTEWVNREGEVMGRLD